MTLKLGQVWRNPMTDTWRVIVRLTPKRVTAMYLHEGRTGVALAGYTFSWPSHEFCEHPMELVE